MVYKLVEINGAPTIKLSEELEKTTLPGEKQVFRVYGADSKPAFDLLCLASETDELLSRTDIVGHQPFGSSTTEIKGGKLEPLSLLLFDEG